MYPHWRAAFAARGTDKRPFITRTAIFLAQVYFYSIAYDPAAFVAIPAKLWVNAHRLTLAARNI